MTSPQQHLNKPFAQQFVTLRTALGLTQTTLAEQLGVTERAIQRWEAGTRSPKAEYLKAFLALCIQQHAFPATQEVAKARSLWKAANLKVLFDEAWVRSLLAEQTPRSSKDKEEAYHNASMPTSIAQRLDWGEEVAEVSFYGRESEQSQLVSWIQEDRCRLIALLGMGGIGKSALAVKLMHQLAPTVTIAIFRSVRNAISCEDLVAGLIQALAPEPIANIPALLHARITLLLTLLQTRRCLVVLDNLETLFQEGEPSGGYRVGYEGYKRLLERLGTTPHQSCIVLTSREKPAELKPLEGPRMPVRSLHLSGLNESDGEQLLFEKHLRGDTVARQQLIAAYSGNPLALKIVAETIREMFASEIAHFLAEGQLIFQGIRALLAQQFVRLSFLEQTILRWLAIVREPTDVTRLLSLFVTSVPRLQLLEALEDLRRRSLVEHGQQRTLFTLQSVVMEFVTDELVKQIAKEVQRKEPDALLTYGLSLASAKEYVRQTQERLLLAPTLSYLGLGATQHRKGIVEQQLSHCLDVLRLLQPDEQGYGATNVMMLLLQLKKNLQNVDLSGCALREASLQGVQMQGASLQNSFVRESTFTQTFGIVTVVAVSRDGMYWAVGSHTGDVLVFLGDSSTPTIILHAHNSVAKIAFSPDGTRLATGGRDSLIKIWHLEQMMLLATLNGQSRVIQGMVFSPNGLRLATSSMNGTVYIWDLLSFQVLHTLHSHVDGVSKVAWSPDGQLLASAGDDSIRLWNPHLGEAIRTLEDEGNGVYGLAFSPDSRRLVSGGTDSLIKVWDVASGRCLESLQGHTKTIIDVSWSPDGRLLASGSFDTTVRIWQTNPVVPYQVLQGHTDNIQSLAFSADGTRLLSGSGDRSMRWWDLTSGACMRFLQGYKLTCYSVAWSPHGNIIASATSDTLVTLWHPTQEKPLHMLRGHTQTVFSVTWSPDGQMLASGGEDHTIRLWSSLTGECLSVIYGEEDSIYALAWNPNGRLLASGSYYDERVRVWDIEKQQYLWASDERIRAVRNLAWSPDGHYLVCGGEDMTVRLWSAEDGTLLKVFKEHQKMIYDVTWSPDGTRLVSCDEAHVYIWDVASDVPILVLSVSECNFALAWSPRGNRLLAGGRDGTISWFETENWTSITVRKAHQSSVQSISFNTEGDTFVSVESDGIIIIWDTERAIPLRTLRPDRPYERLDISGIQGIKEAQKATLHELGAIGN